MNCPKCYEPLRIADRQGVEIDYCPECRGVWLDQGELDKIIERTIQFSAAQAPQERYSREEESHYKKRKYEDKDYKHYKKKKKKTKHLLEEIFDIFD